MVPARRRDVFNRGLTEKTQVNPGPFVEMRVVGLTRKVSYSVPYRDGSCFERLLKVTENNLIFSFSFRNDARGSIRVGTAD